MIISLVLPIPPSTNNLYATVMMTSKTTGRMVPRRVPSKDLKDYKEIVKLMVLAKYGPVKLKPPIKINAVLYAPDWRTIDLDNHKAVGDALAHAFGYDDRYLVRDYWDKEIGKGNKPRVEVTIEGERE